MTANLVYMTGQEPGILRRKRGRGFSYTAPDGTTIAAGAEKTRIEAIGVPPAYEDVWICPVANGHLQATGRDARQRKQYRYHAAWSAAQAETKFSQLIDFGAVLPSLRRRVDKDLQADPGDAEFALAAAVVMIDRASLRVGSPEYTRENGSYGALTLRRRHLTLQGGQMTLQFTAKGGKKVKKAVNDRKLLKLLQDVNDVPGATLLSWIDDDGNAKSLSSQQLNAYLAEISGQDGVTAKTFRTWAGTLAAFKCAELGGQTIKDIAMAAAARLHNTPTVARNSYIHPAVIDLANAKPVLVDPIRLNGLFAAEQRLLGLLKTHAARN
jgi:DNA topoisomerase-1